MPTNRRRLYFKELRFQQLQGFCATARARSFAAAATRLGLSRPALWHQVRELERLLGASLVQRRGRGIQLTEDGQALLELAEPLVAGFALISSTFADLKESIHRRLVVASTASLLANELKAPVRQFYRQHRDIHLTLVDRNTPEALRMVENGDADLAVVGHFADEPTHPLLDYEPLFKRGMMLICAREHELAKQRTIRVRSLVRYPLVMLAKDTVTRRRVDSVFERHGLLRQMNIVLEATNSLLVLDAVALGMGISIVPADPLRDGGRRLHVRPMERWFGEQTGALVRKKGVPAASHVRAFQTLVRRSLAKLDS